MQHEFQTDFEEFPMLVLPKGEAGWVDGYITVLATKHDWELGDVYVYVGASGRYVEKAPQDLADRIRAYFMARKGWVAKVDDEHTEQYSADAIAERRSYAPAWMEPV